MHGQAESVGHCLQRLDTPFKFLERLDIRVAEKTDNLHTPGPEPFQGIDGTRAAARME